MPHCNKSVQADTVKTIERCSLNIHLFLFSDLQIGQTNPRLLHLISDHEESFLNMLNEPNVEEVSDSSNTGGSQAATGGDRSLDDETPTIPMTQQDRDAIERVRISYHYTFLRQLKMYFSLYSLHFSSKH